MLRHNQLKYSMISKKDDLAQEEQTTMTMIQKKIFWTSLLALFSLQTLFLSVETIIPLYIENKHPTISTAQVAFLISCVEVAGFIVSLLIGNFLEKMGRKNAIVIGFIIIVLGTSSLALTDYIINDNTYYIVALICRFIQGTGD